MVYLSIQPKEMRPGLVTSLNAVKKLHLNC